MLVLKSGWLVVYSEVIGSRIVDGGYEFSGTEFCVRTYLIHDT